MKKDLFISEIFNYCDRWCERCSFTDRCAVFEEEEDFSDSEPTDFFKFLEGILEETLSMVETFIQNEEPHLWQKWLDKMEAEWGEEQTNSAFEEELINLSKDYYLQGRAFLDRYRTLFDQTKKNLDDQIQMGLNQQAQVDKWEDALAVIQWYLYFISAKVQRAIKGKNRTWNDHQNPHQNDANGSAKVALIAMERSLSAWDVIRSRLPEVTDDMLDVLVIISKLRSGLQRIFPKTDLFVRPGFDELGEARSDA